MKRIPKTHPVQPLKPGTKAYEEAKVLAVCGTCDRYWDDGAVTSMTPTPGGRCPFEYYH